MTRESVLASREPESRAKWVRIRRSLALPPLPPRRRRPPARKEGSTTSFGDQVELRRRMQCAGAMSESKSGGERVWMLARGYVAFPGEVGAHVVAGGVCGKEVGGERGNWMALGGDAGGGGVDGAWVEMILARRWLASP